VLKYEADIWIDHRKARIVVMALAGERTILSISKVKKRPQCSGDSPLRGGYQADQVPADDRSQKALTGELSIYYDTVTAAARNAESVVTLSPGESKGKLRKQHVKHELGGRVDAVQTADVTADLIVV
jgi:hypothetical protein